MICDSVNDLFSALMKVYFEKDEKKKVFNVVWQCETHVLVCFDAKDVSSEVDLGEVWGFGGNPLKLKKK